MDARDRKIEEVVRVIREAFANTRHPGPDKVVPSDGPSLHLERDQVKALYKDRSWQDVDVPLILANRSSTCFLSTEGFRYFLPGFMIEVLEHHDEIDTLSYTLVCSLSPQDDDPETQRRRFDRLDRLTKPQRDAVRAFLRLYRDEFAEWVDMDDVDLAIEFWECMK